jgi:hypothetical protein
METVNQKIHDALCEALNITPGRWTHSDSMNFSGTHVAFVQNEGQKTIFQSRHNADVYSADQANADSRVAATANIFLTSAIEQTWEFDQFYSTGDQDNPADIWVKSNIALIEASTGKPWKEIKAIYEMVRSKVHTMDNQNDLTVSPEIER